MSYLRLLLEGDHYSQGRQHGYQAKSMRPRIAKAIGLRFAQIEQDGARNGGGARFERLVQESRALLQALDVPLLDLIRGQAEALDLDFDTLLRYSLVSYLRDDLVTHGPAVSNGCTIWGSTGSATADGQPILAKNREYRPEHMDMQVVARVTPKTGYRYLSSGSAGSPGVFGAGINEAGLAVADTHVTSTDLGPGLPDCSLMMHILEEHDSVSSALDYLRSVPRMGRNNLMLADASGHLAVFEIGHRAYGRLETYDGSLVSANHFDSPELRDSFVDDSEPTQQGNSYERYALASRALMEARGQIDVAFTKTLARTHAGPLASLCRHPREDEGSSTISGSIFLPAQRTMLFCYGLPCQGRYEAYRL
jgi:hypothetical protein